MITVEHFLLSVAMWFGLYLIVTLSLNLEFGYCGVPNFGRSLAVLIGGLAVGAIVNRIFIVLFGVTGDIISASATVKSILDPMIMKNPLLGVGIFILMLIVAAAMGYIVGILSALPSARLREFYLAITFFAIACVIFDICKHTPNIAGGYYSINVPNVLAYIAGAQRFVVSTLIILGTALIIYLIVHKLTNSPYGRMLKMIRENELVAKTFGRNIMMSRVKVVAIGSSIAAIGGALYTSMTLSFRTDDFGIVLWTFYPWLIMLLGGLGNNLGIALGTLIVVLIRTLLTIYKYDIVTLLKIPFDPAWFEYILFGTILILIIMFRPEGIVPEKPILTEPLKRLKSKQHSTKSSSPSSVMFKRSK